MLFAKIRMQRRTDTGPASADRGGPAESGRLRTASVRLSGPEWRPLQVYAFRGLWRREAALHGPQTAFPRQGRPSRVTRALNGADRTL